MMMMMMMMMMMIDQVQKRERRVALLETRSYLTIIIIIMQSLGPLNETACQFLEDLGRRISAQSGDERNNQRLSVVIQRFNATLLHNSFEAADHLG